MFASFHRIHGGRVVGMIGSGNGHHINLVIKFGQHFPIVLKSGGTFKLLRPGVHFAVSVIDIAESDHFHIAVFGQVHGVNTSFSARPDMGGADLTVW